MKTSYGPGSAAWVGLVLGGIVAAAIAASLLVSGDHAGALLLAVAALALVSAGVWLSRGPVLILDKTGVRIRNLTGGRSLEWSEIDSLGASSASRRGLTQHSLEIEAGDQLVVLPDWLLGLKRGAGLTELIAAADTLRSTG